MKPIPFRRRLKYLIKDIQRARPGETALQDFRAMSGYEFRDIDDIRRLIKSQHSGSALSRVGREALKRGCFIRYHECHGCSDLRQIRFIRESVLYKIHEPVKIKKTERFDFGSSKPVEGLTRIEGDSYFTYSGYSYHEEPPYEKLKQRILKAAETLVSELAVPEEHKGCPEYALGRIVEKICKLNTHMKIGDRVYYHPENSNIVIECYIEGVFEANPDLVWLDEVVGHAVDVDNLYESFDHARQHITSWSLSYKSLEDYRNQRAVSIMSTWQEENRTTVEEFLKMFEKRKFIILEA